MGEVYRIYLIYTNNTERIKQSTLPNVHLNVHINKIKGQCKKAKKALNGYDVKDENQKWSSLRFLKF